MSAKIVGLAAAGVLALAGVTVAKWEGYSAQPYLDIVGVKTVCAGHTGNVQDKTYTRVECDALLQSDLAKHWAEIQPCIRKPLADHQAAAVLSLGFNVGSGAVCRSMMVKKINLGAAPVEYCRELFKWVYAGGKKVRGLENRRKDEYKLCMGWL